MSRWRHGEATVERLLAQGQVQAVTGAQADGAAWLAKAHRTLTTAERIASQDPDSGYVLAYDAARHAGTALLAQQGLRPTTAGGHYALEQAVRAQFGDPFKPFGTLRRRRNELEYPTFPGDETELDEAEAAISDARRILEATEKLLPHLGFFTV